MTPPRVFSWKPSDSFQNTKGSKNFQINIFSAKDDICISRPYPFKFFKGRLPHILLGPLLNTLSHMFLLSNLKSHGRSHQKLWFTFHLLSISFLQECPIKRFEQFSEYGFIEISSQCLTTSPHIWNQQVRNQVSK